MKFQGCIKEDELILLPRTKTSIEESSLCNGKCDLSSCEDESDCNGVSYGTICMINILVPVLRYIPPLFHCDGGNQCEIPGNASSKGSDELVCDLDQDCGDEKCKSCIHFNRKNNKRPEFYGVVGNTNLTVPITDKFRCAPIEYYISAELPVVPFCDNYRDQTNCSDPQRVAFSCLIDGYPSTVSKSAICHNWPRAELCDDKFENICPKISSFCTMHKHFICDGKVDCPDGADERDCGEMFVSQKTCERRYGNAALPIPIRWLYDKEEDCKDGSDETGDWPVCGENPYMRFVPNDEDGCSDVFVCPGSKTNEFVELGAVCDGVDTCPNENNVCKAAWGVPDIFTQAPVRKVGRITKDLVYCLHGLQDLEWHIAPCTDTRFRYPDIEIFGVDSSSDLLLPNVLVDCSHVYGELYVYMSCNGRCTGGTHTRCPLVRPLTHHSCPEQFSDRAYTLAGYDYLTFVTGQNEHFQYNHVFVCENDRCIPYSKVCDLVNDCGDFSDEVNCVNHFQCIISKTYISVTQKCNDVIDCLDLSDECNEDCGKQVLEGNPLKAASWTIGILASFFNIVILWENSSTVSRCKTSVSLMNKILIMLISLGDLLVGLYLLAVSYADQHYGLGYCAKRMEWLTSSYCSALGVISMVGSSVSLFAMTALSLIRFVGIMNTMSIPAEINKKGVLKVMGIAFGLLAGATAISVIPVIPLFEDYFVNALYYKPKVRLFIGMPGKDTHLSILRVYFGRMKDALLSWGLFRSLTDSMFTQTEGDLVRRNVEFYGNDGVCLFKFFVSQQDPQRIFVWVVIGVNAICFGLITMSYIAINLISLASSKALGSGSNTAKLRNKKMQRKITIIIATDFACWIPFMMVCLLHSAELMNATAWYGFFSMVILPLNSVINPLLYDDTITKHLDRVLAVVAPKAKPAIKYLLRQIKRVSNKMAAYDAPAKLSQ